MEHKHLFVCIIFSIIILGVLRFNENLWPLGFIIPLIIITISIIYSHIITNNIYKKNKHSSLLIGRLSYGIDKDGKPTEKYH